MGISRTLEFLELCNHSPESFIVPSNDGLKNRFKKNRFSLQDQTSPNLETKNEIDSDLESEEDSPLPTFIVKATDINLNIDEARKLVQLSLTSGKLSESAIKPLLDLCYKFVKSLQEYSEQQSSWRRAQKGWIELFTGTENNQLDQHESTIIWFLNHKLSTLSKDFENVKDELKRRELRVYRAKMAASSIPPLKSFNLNPNSTLSDMISDSKLQEDFNMNDSQMRELVTENDALVKEFTEMQGQLEKAQSSISEIAQLQTTLQEQLVFQSTQIDRLFDDAQTTADTVKKANVHLNRASSHQSASVRFFLYFVFFATIFIFILHLISS